MWLKYLYINLMYINETQTHLEGVSCLFHFHQVVWSSSYKVGCGVALCSNTYFYGCQYYRAYVALCSHVNPLTLARNLNKKPIVFDRGNFKGWIPYTNGSSCASCPGNCEDKLCSEYSHTRGTETPVNHSKITGFLFASFQPIPVLS